MSFQVIPVLVGEDALLSPVFEVQAMIYGSAFVKLEH